MENFKRSLVKQTLFLPEKVDKVRHWLTEKAGSTLSAFASFVCKQFDFTDARGVLQTETCKTALKALDAQGSISLQDFLGYTSKTTSHHSPQCLQDAVPQPEGVPGRVDEIKDLKLIRVHDESERLTWNRVMQDEHYLGAQMPPGRRFCYLLYSEHGLLGAIGFTSAAANRLKPRDKWIGWTDDVRQQNLEYVINMNRFLIRPGVHCHDLASKAISMSLKAVAKDSLEEYQIAPCLVETFVDSEKFDGTCYKAAGWELLGLTQGRGWNDRENKPQLSLKHIFVRPLVSDFRERLGVSPQAFYPAWAIAEPLRLSDELEAESWAKNEFGSSKLGHKDRNERLIYSAEKIAKNPHFSANMAFEGDPSGSRGWYYFVESKHQSVNFESILSGPEESTYRRMKSEKVVLAVQDDTKLNYTSKPQISGLGTISRNQTGAESKGLIVHTTMAFTPDGVPIGIVKATCFVRKPKSEKPKKLPVKERESYFWVEHAELLNEIGQYMPDTRLISVCDRGADIAYYIHKCDAMEHCDLLVRAKADRRIPEEEQTLFEVMASQKPAGTLTVTIERKSERPKLSCKAAVKKRKEREATLNVSFCQVKIAPPPEMKGKEPVKVTAVYAEEVNPPEDEKKVEWRLLTTLAVNSFDEAAQCIEFYTKRWGIEEFHRVLKTGCRVEELANNNITRLERALAVYIVIAWRLMLLNKLGRKNPEAPLETVLSDIEIEVLRKVFAKRKARPLTGLYSAIVLISKLGGYLDRYNDPPPGYEVFWRGYEKFQAMCEYALICKENEHR